MSNEELGPRDLIAHAISLSTSMQLITLCDEYIEAPPGSGAEEIAEKALSLAIGKVLEKGPNFTGGIMLGLLSLISAVGTEKSIQEWFDGQAEQVAIALEGAITDEPRE